MTVTIDDFLGGALHIEQAKNGYRAGLDPVFLAAACPCSAGDLVLDLGCGHGVAALCLASRVSGVHAVGVDDDLDQLTRGVRNAARNPVAAKLSWLAGRAPDLPLPAGHFDHIITNPPFLAAGTARASDNPAKRRATIESIPLAAWLACAWRHLKPGGSLTIIHRGDRLFDVISALANHGRGTAIFPLWPASGTSVAERVIVKAVKGNKAPMALLQGMVVHTDQGGFTPSAQAVLRGGGAVSWRSSDKEK